MNWRHLFLSLDGRIARRDFWIGMAAIVAAQLLVMVPLMSRWNIDPDAGLPPVWFRNVSLLLDTVCAFPVFAICVKRQQDRDQTAGLSLLFVTAWLAFSVVEAFGLTQAGRNYTAIGWMFGVPLLAMAVIIIVELGGRPGTPGPNRFGSGPTHLN